MMEGYEAQSNGAVPDSRAGISPRLLQDLFSMLQDGCATSGGASTTASEGTIVDFKVQVTCLEIYNEQVCGVDEPPSAFDPCATI